MSESTKGNEDTLSHKQRCVARLIALGHTQVASAGMMKVHPARVTRWKKNEAFTDFLARMMGEVENRIEAARDILKEGAPQAALKVLDLLDSEDEGIQLRASGNILDRVGISKVSKVEAEVSGELGLYDILAKAEKDDRVKRSQED